MRACKKNDCELVKQNEKFMKFYRVLCSWLEIHQLGGSIEEYFVVNGYKRIAIYGYKELGFYLKNELEKSSVDVKYIVDREFDSIVENVCVISPDEKIDDVDVVVVTAIQQYEEIKNNYKQKVNCPIISLGKMLENIIGNMS